MSDTKTPDKLSNNALTVLALANEYCRALELASAVEPHEFVDKMIHLLPRIYITVTDLPSPVVPDDEYPLDAVHLNEAYYDRIRQDIAATLGEHDTYLETFHEDMKYSDTPIAATVSEGLADLFQVLYNFVEDVRSADVDVTYDHLGSLREEFDRYWSQTLCNVMRPLNELRLTLQEELTDPDDFEYD